MEEFRTIEEAREAKERLIKDINSMILSFERYYDVEAVLIEIREESDLEVNKYYEIEAKIK